MTIKRLGQQKLYNLYGVPEKRKTYFQFHTTLHMVGDFYPQIVMARLEELGALTIFTFNKFRVLNSYFLMEQVFRVMDKTRLRTGILTLWLQLSYIIGTFRLFRPLSKCLLKNSFFMLLWLDKVTVSEILIYYKQDSTLLKPSLIQHPSRGK